jgi:hypothetical protein
MTMLAGSRLDPRSPTIYVLDANGVIRDNGLVYLRVVIGPVADDRELSAEPLYLISTAQRDHRVHLLQRSSSDGHGRCARRKTNSAWRKSDDRCHFAP